MNKFIVLIILSIACVTIQAQVYSYVDANGNTIYTDTPPQGQKTKSLNIEVTPKQDINNNTSAASELKTVRLSPTQTATSTQNRTPPRSTTYNNNVKPMVSYQSFKIVSPKPNETIANTGGQMMINVESHPPLLTGHNYRILIDNKVVATAPSAAFSLNNLERGEHKLIAQIINANNQVISKSPEQIFYIRQPTLADRKRINPCKLKDYGVRPECPLKDKPKLEPVLRRITNTLGLTVKCEAQDYGKKQGCPLKK